MEYTRPPLPPITFVSPQFSLPDILLLSGWRRRVKFCLLQGKKNIPPEMIVKWSWAPLFWGGEGVLPVTHVAKIPSPFITGFTKTNTTFCLKKHPVLWSDCRSVTWTVHALTSSGPEVKKYCNWRALYPCTMILSKELQEHVNAIICALNTSQRI